MITLRPYQEEALEKIKEVYLSDDKIGAILLPTGTGKSIIFAKAIKDLLKKGQAAVIVPWDILVDNAVSVLSMFYPLTDIGVVKAERNEHQKKVVVISIQTILSENRRDVLPKFSMIMVDELHYYGAPVWKKALLDMVTKDTLLIGFTATIERTDQTGMSSVFGKLIYQKKLSEMIEAGYLCNLQGIRIDAKVDLSSFRENMSDSELEQILKTDKSYDLLWEGWESYAKDRITMAFTPTVKMAQELCLYWQQKGIKAAWVSGEMNREDSRKVIADFTTGRVQCLFNALKLAVGFDHRPIQCIFIIRPTRSRTFYIQMCLDDKTEILTPEGWKGIEDLESISTVAGFDISSSKINWVPVTNKIKRPIEKDESYIGIKTSSLDFNITNKHDMIVRTRHGRKKIRSLWKKKTAEEVLTLGDTYEIPIAGFQDAPGIELSDSEIDFLGWFLTDGCINKTRTQISICQSTKQTWFGEIKRCLDACNFNYKVYIAKEDSHGAFKQNAPIAIYSLRKNDTEGHRGWRCIEKYLYKNIAPELEDITRDQLKILLHSMHLGNGSKQINNSWIRRSYHIYLPLQEAAEKIQSLCIRRGFKCNIAIQVSPTTGKNLYILHIKNKYVHSIQNKPSDGRPPLQKIDYDGKEVWCVSNELGTLVTRRNGMVAILGNCGRGTRTCPQEIYDQCISGIKDVVLPSKEDCLILDAGGASDLGLVQYPDLFDLPEAAVQAIKERQRTDPTIPVPFHETFKTKSAGLHAERIDLLNESKYNWVQNRYGWSISLGTEGSVYLDSMPGLGYVIRVGKEFIQEFPIALDWAMALAETWIKDQLRGKKKSLANRSAKWRQKDITEKQFYMLKRMKVSFVGWNSYTDYLYQAKELMTTGEASDLLAKVFAEKRK